MPSSDGEAQDGLRPSRRGDVPDAEPRERRSSDGQDPDRLDLDEVRAFLARRWRLVLAVAAGCAALALVACLLMTPVYTATTQILLDPHRTHAFGQDAVQPDAALDSSIVDSQISILTSTRLLAKVISKEHLADDPEFAASAKPGLIGRLTALFRHAKPQPDVGPALDGIDPKLAPVIVHFFSRVEVARIAKSYVLSVAVTSREPAKATRLANALAQTFVEDRVDVHARSVQQAATFFEDRLGSLREQVRQSERAVADYRKAHDLLATTTDGQVNISEQQLQDLNQQLALASTDTAEKLARFQQAVRFRDGGGAVDTLPDVVRSPVVVALRAQQADLMRRDADLSATYGPQYPAIAQIRAQKTGLDRAVAVEVRRLVAASRNDYDVAAAREAALRKTIGRLTDTSGGNDVGVKLRELERTNQANRALFENFLNRAKLAQEQSTFEEPDARLISPALEPTAPTAPKTKLIVPMGGVAGLILGLGLAALVDRRRDDRPPSWRRQSAAEREEPADAPPAVAAFILGQLPPSDAAPDGVDALCGEATAGRAPAYARAVAGLAARLKPPAGEHRALLLVEPADASSRAAPPLGDTLAGVALALAAALARGGSRILVVDAADGALSRACAAGDAPGLAAVAAGHLAAEDAILERNGFAVLPAGAAPVPPRRLGAFLGEARGFFDMVLVAADIGGTATIPPLDGTVLVASPEMGGFAASVDALAASPHFLGLILTGAVAAADALLAG